MKKTSEKPVIVTLIGKDHYFKARIPLWKAYLILADVEKHEEEIKKLAEKREKFTQITKKRK